MQNLGLSSAITSKIETLIGMKIPIVGVPKKAGSVYYEVLQIGKPRLIDDPLAIRHLMMEPIEVLHSPAKQLVQKL